MDVQNLLAARRAAAARRSRARSEGTLTGVAESESTDAELVTFTGGFDPSSSSVGDVRAHVEKHPDDLAGILEVEQARPKPRKGVVALAPSE